MTPPHSFRATQPLEYKTRFHPWHLYRGDFLHAIRLFNQIPKAPFALISYNVPIIPVSYQTKGRNVRTSDRNLSVRPSVRGADAPFRPLVSSTLQISLIYIKTNCETPQMPTGPQQGCYQFDLPPMSLKRFAPLSSASLRSSPFTINGMTVWEIRTLPPVQPSIRAAIIPFIFWYPVLYHNTLQDDLNCGLDNCKVYTIRAATCSFGPCSGVQRPY